jgi:hypothetical protein
VKSLRTQLQRIDQSSNVNPANNVDPVANPDADAANPHVNFFIRQVNRFITWARNRINELF